MKVDKKKELEKKFNILIIKTKKVEGYYLIKKYTVYQAGHFDKFMLITHKIYDTLEEIENDLENKKYIR